MPTEADELWISAVSSAPVSTPRTGLVNSVNSRVNSGTSASGLTAPDMASMPNIRIAKPSNIDPVLRSRSFFENMYIATPASARTGAKDDGFSSRTTTLSPSTPDRLRIHDVAVVPTFAPIITVQA